jgi:hypothetical protein
MRIYSKGKSFLLSCVLAAGMVLPVLTGEAMEIASLEEKIILESTGAARVETSVKFAKAEAGTLLIPSSFKSVDGLKVEGATGASAALTEKDGVRVFAVTLSEAPKEKQEIKLSFTVPDFYDWKKEKVKDFGNRGLQYRFLNTLPNKVQSYAMELVLPPGFIVNTVEESQPKLTSKTPVPPYKIVRKDNQYGIALKASKLGVGDYSMVRIRFKDGGKSMAFVLVALVICGIYLVSFRSIIGPGMAEAKPAPACDC